MNAIIFRQWFNNKIYPILFSLCIIVSLGAFLTLDALQQSVNNYINTNQKQIVGGDIVITDNQAFPPGLLEKVKELNPENVVFDYQFNAISYTPKKSVLARIKAVTSQYPLYGDLELKNNRHNWPRGSVVVEQQILSSLNSSIGDKIQIGEAEFLIHDEIITEPDRPLTAFGFGARVLMHAKDLDKTELVGQRSRVNYRIEIRQNTLSSAELLSKLKQHTLNTSISVKTAEESNTSISNLSQNFLIFLKLLVIAVIILSGIGIMSIVRAFVTRQQQTNAIRTALGEKSYDIINSFRLLFFLMTLTSVTLAWLASYLVLYFGQEIFTSILPQNIDVAITWASFFKAALIGVSLTAVMTHFSLNSIRLIKPIAVLHQHLEILPILKGSWLWVFFSLVAVMALIYSELKNLTQSAYILIGLLLVWLIFSLLTKALMFSLNFLLTKGVIKQWMLALSMQNIFRKGNQSALFITALSMTTMILGSISILDHSIHQQLISTYPDDSPNFFLLDIQTNQQDSLNKMIGKRLTYYPVIRARIDSVNGVKASVLKDKLSRYDRITRVFNLSYSESIMATEYLYKSLSGELFSTKENETTAVSILSSFADFLEVDLGDEISFNVQGIIIKSKITSIRKRLKKGPSPFFYFIFPPDVMAEAPQIRFATAKVEEQQRVNLQTEIAKKFPGITTLDGARIAKKLKIFVDQLKQLIQLFTALSLFAGGLIFATSLLSTSQDRLRESFYYKMMGMESKDLLKLSLIEFISLGLFAFYLGLFVAVIVSYIISVNWFSLNFIFPWYYFFIANISIIILMITVSVIYSNYVKKSKVNHYLQHES